MKRAVMMSVFVLGACTPTFLESGRYACERGEADQCPGAWRCGLEGFCHQQGDTSVAWRCESSDDCEGVFVCGLSRTREFHECHDPAAPQDWPCEQPTDCVGGWSCGLSTTGEGRQCHDPAAPKAWPCETSVDCVGGWSCGLMSDGERHECHDPLNPRAWTCVADTDCVGGWRCGTERVCVDPSADALGQLVLAQLDGGAQVNSLTSKSPITRLSISPFYGEGRGRGRGNAAFVQDGHLRAVSLEASGGRTASYDLGTELPTAFLAHGARGQDEFGNPDELERVSMLWADGGLTTLRFADGGLLGNQSYGEAIAPFDLLGHGSAATGLMPSVYATTAQPDDWYARIKGDDLFMYDLLPDPAYWTDFKAVPGNRIHSIAGLRHLDALECVYVVDDRGLWVSQRGDRLPSGDYIASWAFEPVSLDPFKHAACPASRGPKIDSVRSVGDRWLAVTAKSPGGPVEVAVMDADRTWVGRGGVGSEVFCSSWEARPCDADDRIKVDPVFGPCTACPAGSAFLGMSTVVGAANTPPALEVACGQQGTPATVFRLSSTTGSTECVRTLITGGSSYFATPSPQPSEPAPGVVAWSGSSGQLWFGTDSASLASLTFDRAATGMVRRGAGPNDYLAFTPQLVGVPSTDGLSSTRASSLTSAVENAPSLAVAGTQLVELSGTAISSGRTVGYVAGLSLPSPVSAAISRSAGGNRFAMIAAGSTVYAGDVEQALAMTGAAVGLSQRVSTVEPISALAFPLQQPAGGTALLSGYAIVGANLVRVVAESSTRWRTEAVPLPSTLFPVATWFQGARGRVGFHDGSVFSLPSRVRISEPLPGGEAVDFAQTCGQQLALAPNGLFRLETEASGPIGRWRQLSLPPEISGLDFTEGRVHALGNDVFVFTRVGEAARITFDTCPE